MTMAKSCFATSVARPVANLGNTCYMNAVLQALAHAPELVLAMEGQPHSPQCPIAAENANRRLSSRSSSPDEAAGTRKSRRSGRKSPQEGDDRSRDWEYCALCEVENHIRQVHDYTKKDKPFAPTTFVNGFIEHVAPWFKLGVQEDSHEFLRILIDAMQKSCVSARVGVNPQDQSQGHPEASLGEEKEYPFSLFRGMVESNVTCDYCKASSSTMDPIEDIGLEVTLPASAEPASRNSSPTPSSSALADIQSAFERFVRAESLDSGYKCEKCGKVGGATKQSRLGSIPPILTLHLKRFRYGDSRATTTMTSSMAGRRTGRSEVNQLLGNQSDFLLGKSGSTKIEGHIKFGELFDLKPYLTDKLLSESKGPTLCRLFAVIVHAGTNSHSGHYIAYVRSLEKNDWWKMDDGRVMPVSYNEVHQAEAYMLFYRVVKHPMTVELERALDRKWKAEVEIVEPTTDRSKRKRSEYENGETWARAKTNLPPHLLGLFYKAEEMIADRTQISADYFKVLAEEANKEGADIGVGPSTSISESDILGGAEKFRHLVLNLFHNLAKHFEKETGNGKFWLKEAKDIPAVVELQADDTAKGVLSTT